MYVCIYTMLTSYKVLPSVYLRICTDVYMFTCWYMNHIHLGLYDISGFLLYITMIHLAVCFIEDCAFLSVRLQVQYWLASMKTDI